MARNAPQRIDGPDRLMHAATTRRSESGQAMVEFSMGAFVLFLVIFSLMVMGHTFGKQLDLKGATRDAARRAAVHAEQDNAVTIARQHFYDQLSLTRDGGATVTFSPPPPWDHGETIVVRSAAPHGMNVMGVLRWQGTLCAESTIRVE